MYKRQIERLERKSQKAHERLDAAREKLPTKKVLKKERVFDEGTGKMCIRDRAVWGVVNLMEGYGNDNPGAKSQGIKQLMAGGGVVLIGTTLIPLLSGLFG